MKVLVTGASGFVGTALCAALEAAGDTVIRLVRAEPRGPAELRWNPAAGTIDTAALHSVVPLDAVIHLAGENVGAGRWTPERKARILESRRTSTRLLADTLAGLEPKPAVLLSASATGYYGDRGEEVLEEASTPGNDFLAQVCQEWESAAEPARAAGIRVVHPRIGIVLSAEGGPLEKMLPPFRFGLGGPLGSGRQWLGWITREDVVGALQHALTTSTLSGPVNFVAPNPVRNVEFAGALGKALHRPALLPVPAFALRLLLGEVADAILASQRIVPRRLLESGYPFRHPDLGPAFQQMFR